MAAGLQRVYGGDKAERYDVLFQETAGETGSLGADFQDNPTWYLRRVISAHPVGGCPMGDDESMGVVDPHGRVFNYPGLYIADGSVMPGPVGTNPSLTIAALADRTADAILTDHTRR